MVRVGSSKSFGPFVGTNVGKSAVIVSTVCQSVVRRQPNGTR
jgi:hypothetical protein